MDKVARAWLWATQPWCYRLVASKQLYETVRCQEVITGYPDGRFGGKDGISYENVCQSSEQAEGFYKSCIVERPDGSEKVTVQVRVTPKGLVCLSEAFGAEAA